MTLHFADKRDLGTLEYRMITIVQGSHQSVEEFYQVVYKHLSLILYKLGSLGPGREAEMVMTKSYRYSSGYFCQRTARLLISFTWDKEPTDLPTALHLCLKLENQSFRTNYATSRIQNNNNQFRIIDQRQTSLRPTPAPLTIMTSNNPDYRQPPPVPPRNLPQKKPNQYA